MARLRPPARFQFLAAGQSQRCVPGEEGQPPEAASRAIDEYLAVLDDAAFGAATPVTPKLISPADPASRWTGSSPTARTTHPGSLSSDSGGTRRDSAAGSG